MGICLSVTVLLQSSGSVHSDDVLLCKMVFAAVNVAKNVRSIEAMSIISQ